MSSEIASTSPRTCNLLLSQEIRFCSINPHVSLEEQSQSPSVLPDKSLSVFSTKREKGFYHNKGSCGFRQMPAKHKKFCLYSSTVVKVLGYG